MDSTVIQEIANQLGMAVDQAGQFIAEHLPDFAALKSLQCTVPLVCLWIIVAVCLIVSLASLALAAHERKKCMEEEEQPRWYKTNEWDRYTGFLVFMFAGIAFMIMLLIAAITTGFILPDIIGWSNYPEAMLIDMALKAVQ